MINEVFSLAFALFQKGYINEQNSVSLAHDVVEVASSEEPLFDGENAREKTAKLLYVWAVKESAGIVNIKGDSGWSIGRMQFRKTWLNSPTLIYFNAKEEDVLSDGKLALKMGLAIMRDLKASCKGVKGALKAYASGSCIGNMKSKTIVEERCKMIGGC